MAVINLTEENYNEVVSDKDSVVIVDFWAEWCVPCKLLAPELEKLSERHPEIVVCKVNVDEYPELARELRLMSIPALVVYTNGTPSRQYFGYKTVEELEKLIFW